MFESKHALLRHIMIRSDKYPDHNSEKHLDY